MLSWSKARRGYQAGEELEHLLKEGRDHSVILFSSLWGCAEMKEPDSSWRGMGSGQEARDAAATGKVQLDVGIYLFVFFQEAPVKLNNWVLLRVISDLLRSLAVCSGGQEGQRCLGVH